MTSNALLGVAVPLGRHFAVVDRADAVVGHRRVPSPSNIARVALGGAFTNPDRTQGDAVVTYVELQEVSI